MSKKGKKDVLEASPNTEGTENARGVAAEGKIGKGLPPKAHRWKPGQSGNPSGKPSARRAVNVEVITEALGRIDPKLDKSQLEIIVNHSIRRAKQGSYKDIKLMLAYGLGMPKQAVEVEGQFSYTDALTEMRAKRLAEADQTITSYMLHPGLPVVGPTNGHSTPEIAQAAAAMPEEDLTLASEDAGLPAVDRGPIKRVVV